MILFYNYYFRFDSKQVFECFFFPFALLQNYAYSQVEQCVRFVKRCITLWSLCNSVWSLHRFCFFDGFFDCLDKLGIGFSCSGIEGISIMGFVVSGTDFTLFQHVLYPLLC